MSPTNRKPELEGEARRTPVHPWSCWKQPRSARMAKQFATESEFPSRTHGKSQSHLSKEQQTLEQTKQCKNSHKLRYRSGINGGQIGCAVNLNTHLLTSPEPIMVGLISRCYPYSHRGLTAFPGVLMHTVCSAFYLDTWARGERRAMEMAHPGDIHKFGRCNNSCFVFILTFQKDRVQKSPNQFNFL